MTNRKRGTRDSLMTSISSDGIINPIRCNSARSALPGRGALRSIQRVMRQQAAQSRSFVILAADVRSLTMVAIPFRNTA
jgi:hypothetical protein